MLVVFDGIAWLDVDGGVEDCAAELLGDRLRVGGVLFYDVVFVDVVTVKEGGGAKEDKEGGKGDRNRVFEEELFGRGASCEGAVVGWPLRAEVSCERGFGPAWSGMDVREADWG